MIQQLIGALLAIVVGVAMLPVVIDTIDDVDTADMPTGVEALVDLLPILFVIIIVAGAVTYVSFGRNR